MKKRLAPILLSLIALAALAAWAAPWSTLQPPAQAQAATEARVNLHVEGMHCATCPITVRTVLSRLDGVSHVTVSMADKRAHVVYDPRQVTPAQMAHAVTDAGYRTTVESGDGT